MCSMPRFDGGSRLNTEMPSYMVMAVLEFVISRLKMPSSSCKSCALAFLQACDEKGEEGHCPICRSGPVRVCKYLSVKY